MNKYYKVLDFLSKYSGKQYKLLEKCDSIEEVEFMQQGNHDGKESWNIFKDLISAIEQNTSLKNKKLTQWQNSGNFVRYIWCQFKKEAYVNSNISISLFAEMVDHVARYRISVELEEKDASDVDIERYKKILDVPLKDGLVYVLGGNNSKEFEILTETNNVAVKQKNYSKVQVSKIFYSDEKATDKIFVENILDGINDLDEYYDYALVREDDAWWPSKDEYDPNITKDKWLEILNNKDIMEDDWYIWLAMFYDYGGEGTCSKIAERYGVSISKFRNSLGMHFAERVCKYMDKPTPGMGDNAKLWPVVFLGKSALDKTAGSYIWKLRPELYDALTGFDILKYLPEEHHAGIFDSWEIIDEKTAVKHCDKTFFEHSTTGVPKEICWFFDGDKISNGEKTSINLIYENVSYHAEFSKNSSGSSSIRWNSIFKVITDKVRKNNLSAVFTKIDGESFSIEFKGGEPEMTTKQMIDEIKKYIASKGFTYEGNLIENFYLSLKSKPFVILAGTSGTGKTRLAKLFAEAIGATSENGQYKLVPVRPDWSDSSDLFGHVNLKGEFTEGAIISFIKEAYDHKGKPYFLIFDEMNLARVEYYMSDFLSILETRKRKGNEIVTEPLFSDSIFGNDEKAKEKYSGLVIPENLYIIGTVNMDETTFPFSKKVLDRANTIEFSYVDLTPVFNDTDSEMKPLPLQNDFIKPEFLRLQECRDYSDTVQKTCDELIRINDKLRDADLHIGYRVRDDFSFYMINREKAGVLTFNEAFDNQIMQKILPRIQGSSSSVRGVIQELFKICAGDCSGYSGNSENEKMRSYTEQKSDNCRYKKSAEKLTYMMRRYEEDGFTSYWL